MYIFISVWNLNLSGAGYKIDLMRDPFIEENPVFTTNASVSDSVEFQHFSAVVPENRKCWIYTLEDSKSYLATV